MYSGNELWNKTLVRNMTEKKMTDGSLIQTYSDMPRTPYESFRQTAERMPNKTAIVDDNGTSCSYKNLLDHVTQFSSWLLNEREVKKGDHVAVILFNSIEFCVTYLALNRLGAVVIPLPTKYRKEEVRSLLEKADVNYVISHELFYHYFDGYEAQGVDVTRIPETRDAYALADFCGSLEDTELLDYEAEVLDTDPALLMFTSGTTSRSKGVLLRNYNIMHAIVSYERTLGIGETDKAILPIPIYLVTGLVAVFGLFLHVGGTIYLNRVFDAKRVLSDIRKYEVTFFHASPTVFTLLLTEQHNFPQLPSLRMFACGSSNMPPGKIRMLHQWLPDCEFRTIYGLTETTSPGTVFPMDANDSDYIGSSGIPIPGLCFKITNDLGEEVDAGVQGEVWVKGSNVTEGYYKLETDTIRERWLNTGDIGYFNQDGYLYIVDRRKDMINRGGEKICSFDVENELLCIDDIKDAAVVGIPHELYGEIPVAVVQLCEGSTLTEQEIKQMLRTKMARFKVPEKIVAVDQIPLTENLKTNKRKIREFFIQEGQA